MSAGKLEYTMGIHGWRDSYDSRRGAKSKEGARNLSTVFVDYGNNFLTSRHLIFDGADAHL